MSVTQATFSVVLQLFGSPGPSETPREPEPLNCGHRSLDSATWLHTMRQNIGTRIRRLIHSLFSGTRNRVSPPGLALLQGTLAHKEVAYEPFSGSLTTCHHSLVYPKACFRWLSRWLTRTASTWVRSDIIWLTFGSDTFCSACPINFPEGNSQINSWARKESPPINSRCSLLNTLTLSSITPKRDEQRTFRQHRGRHLIGRDIHRDWKEVSILTVKNDEL